MMFNKAFLTSMMYFMATFSSWGAYYNTIKVDGYMIGLNKNNQGVVDVHSDTSNVSASCKIKNWNGKYYLGAGIISLTSDKVGVIVAGSNMFLKTKELEACNNKFVNLYSVDYLDQKLSTIVDVNFDKKLILALVPIDAQSGAHQAIISSFDGKKNVISGKGFWNPQVKDVNISDDTFPVTDDFYIGKISTNGMYVAPNDLDCSVNSFPGVWDVAKKMKVVFPSDKDNSVVESKCQELFSGSKTLNELGGMLLPNKS
ncbi:hypothetical protein [Enterobacter bugandensis]|uniref:hypothetical protein n=1 Tax=Enterobacter bugandensis TaxID=881260 RepID=UPI000C1DEF69|nr:hypothetical protein [Enterobacter bugandensis]PJD01775.1 hypothetical protein B9Q19_23235 [Enterobacter bugandensis]